MGATRGSNNRTSTILIRLSTRDWKACMSRYGMMVETVVRLFLNIDSCVCFGLFTSFTCAKAKQV